MDIFQPTLAQIETNKKESLESKKRLAEETVGLRSKKPEDQLLHLPQILKSFFAEIDSLSKRARFSETAYQDLAGRVPLIISEGVAAKDLEISELLRVVEDARRAHHGQITVDSQLQASRLEAAQNEIEQLQQELATLKKNQNFLHGRLQATQELLQAKDSQIEEMSRAPPRKVATPDIVPSLVTTSVVEEPIKVEIRDERNYKGELFKRENEIAKLKEELTLLQKEAVMIRENEKTAVSHGVGTSLIQILESQRDRFRNRSLDLENERDQLRREVQDKPKKKIWPIFDPRIKIYFFSYLGFLHLLVFIMLFRMTQLE